MAKTPNPNKIPGYHGERPEPVEPYYKRIGLTKEQWINAHIKLQK